MPWDVPVGLLLKGGLAAFEQRARIVAVMQRLIYFLRKGILRIAVFGPGGVGKSELGRFLSASDPRSVKPITYIPSRKIERAALSGGFVGGLVIVPGQEELFPEDWETLFAYLAEGKSRIVINIVAWGYHSFDQIGYQDLPQFQPGTTKEQVFDAYVRARRVVEETLIESMKSHLVAPSGTIRMLTLVTKQDLWWDDQKDVQKHYENGAYGKVIGQIQEERKRLNRRFVHEYLPVSLVSSNFRDGRGELLAPTTKGYDHNYQQVYQAKLIEIVREYADR